MSQLDTSQKLKTATTLTPAPSSILQRKCACGTHTIAGDKCDECKNKQGVLQRKSSNDSEHLEVPPIVYEVLNSSGQPLDKSTRAFFESRFEHNFSQVPISSVSQQLSQSSLTVGEPADIYEQEADRVADSVMSKGENESSLTNEQQGGKFGLSQVRVHTDARAAESARAVNALAYTVGNNIVFGAGQFKPGTHKGQRLIAHELTHVVQQSGADELRVGQTNGNRNLIPIHRLSKGTPTVIQRDDAGGGSTEFTDRVSMTNRHATNVIDGTVTRTETAPASGSQPREEIYRDEMNVRFDPSDCSVTIPFGYNFVQAAQSARADICNEPPPTTAVQPLSADRFNRIKADMLAGINRGLNGWFDVQLTGASCPTGCAGRALPITVVAREDTANPNITITVVNRGGRANAGTICAGSHSQTTTVHEGGHQVLGLGDEYKETDESYRATAPQWFRTERVRHDYSVMGPGQHTRFAMFQERHFNAVKVFLENVFPGCTATLQARARPVIPDFRLTLGGGYASLNRTSGTFFGVGLSVGIPLDRLRRWEFILGPQFNLLTASDDRGNMEAFLLGARLGLERSTGEAGHGFTAGVFGEAGGGRFRSTDYSLGGSGSRSATSAYGELGASAGYRSPILGEALRFNVRLEGAAGTTIGAPGIIGPATRDIETDPVRSRWFRLGLTVGGEF